MISRKIAVSRVDKSRLQVLLQSELALGVGVGRPHLIELQERLSRATVVDSQEMLPDVITMNSTVKLLKEATKPNAVAIAVGAARLTIGVFVNGDGFSKRSSAPNISSTQVNRNS